MQGQMLDLYRERVTLEERNFIEQSKAQIFLEVVFVVETM